MTHTAMTPENQQTKIVMPKRPRRISPDCAEVLHVLAAFDLRADTAKSPSDKA